MKHFYFVLIGMALINICYAVTSIPAAGLTSMIKKGTCLPKYNWCPTFAEDTNMGFILHAKANQPLSSMSLNYMELNMPCLIWKAAGGKQNAIAQLIITDGAGKTLLLAREC